MTKPKLTLDQQVTYQITVPGLLTEKSPGWNWAVSVSEEASEDGLPVTILVAQVDQAALHGLLRRLYGMGLPLISIQLLG
jgi:hypothetical protein